MDGVDARVSFSVMNPLSRDDTLHCRVLAIDHITIDRGWDARDVCSPYWRFYSNSRDGAEVILVGGERYPLRARQVHFIPAWVRFSCRNTVPIEHLFAHVELVDLPGSVVREVFPRPASIPLDPALRTAADRLIDRLRDPALAAVSLACHVKSLVYEALGRLFAALPPDRIQRCLDLGHRDNVVAPALRIIDDRFHESLSNAELAGACHLSEDHFIRRFRAVAGQTPAQYVQERRVAAAAQRLQFTDEPIEAIAEACGFGDRFYFSRVFRRHLGQPPAAYRTSRRV